MSDCWIFGLNGLFIASIAYWAFSAWREIWIYRRIKESFLIITRLTRAPDTFDLERIPDCLITRGTYRNRRVAFRLSRIVPTKLFYYRVDIHCHIEPSVKIKNSVTYKATALTETKRYFLNEKLSEREILDILDEVSSSAEAAESR